MNTTLTIAKNTFRETIRDKILMSAWFVIIGIILFSLFVGSISHDHNVRIITNFSVSAIYILQVFIALFLGSYLMYKEIDKKTFFLIIPKPVSRFSIIIGKCIGLLLAAVCTTFFSTLFLFVLLFAFGGTSYIIPIIIATLLSLAETSLLILISITFSSFMSPVLAFVSAFSVYLISHGGEILRFMYMTTETPIVATVTKFIYHVMPNFEKFNIRNDIVYGTLPTMQMIGFSMLYWAAYAAILIFIAYQVFKRKEF